MGRRLRNSKRVWHNSINSKVYVGFLYYNEPVDKRRKARLGESPRFGFA